MGGLISAIFTFRSSGFPFRCFLVLSRPVSSSRATPAAVNTVPFPASVVSPNSRHYKIAHLSCVQQRARVTTKITKHEFWHHPKSRRLTHYNPEFGPDGKSTNLNACWVDCWDNICVCAFSISYRDLNLFAEYQNKDSLSGYWLKHVFGLSFFDPQHVEATYNDTLYPAIESCPELLDFHEYVTKTYVSTNVSPLTCGLDSPSRTGLIRHVLLTDAIHFTAPYWKLSS